MLSHKTTIAIGGQGGSGTRLIAELFKAHGFNIGTSVNKALDNLLFTLLFRRSSWSESYPDEREVKKAIDVFLACSYASTDKLPCDLTRQYIAELIDSKTTTMYTAEQWHQLISEHFENLDAQANKHPNLVWKEPNTHVFLSQLNNNIDELKYIHVVRNGLYMSQSKNQNQLKLWSKALNVTLSEPLESVSNALNYWCISNQRAIDYGTREMPGSFYIADYDKICANPTSELFNLLRFVGIEPEENTIASLASNIVHTKLELSEYAKLESQLSEEQLMSYKAISDIVEDFSG